MNLSLEQSILLASGLVLLLVVVTLWWLARRRRQRERERIIAKVKNQQGKQATVSRRYQLDRRGEVERRDSEIPERRHGERRQD